MSQKSIEIILFRQLASYLAMPFFIIDQDGNLIFYNEPAEKILGFKYSDAGEIPASEWSTIFVPHDENGNPTSSELSPLSISFRQHKPAHGILYIMNVQNKIWHGQIYTFPVTNQFDAFLGIVAYFQEIEA